MIRAKNRPARIFPLTLCLFAAVSTGNRIQAQEGAALTISVLCNGQREVRQVSGRPLVLQIVISNPAAMNELLDSIAAEPEQKKGTSAQAGSTPRIGPVTLGTRTKPASALLTFTLSAKDGSGKRTIKPHLLAFYRKQSNEPVTIDGRNAFRCDFGIEAKDLPGAGRGPMTIMSHLAPKPTGTEMIEEEPLTVEMVAENQLTPAEVVRSQYLSGNYYILDEKFEKAEPFAAALEKTAPQLAAALRAEMYLGLGDRTKAREACRQALALYSQNSKGEKNPEPPLVLFELLRRIDEAKP